MAQWATERSPMVSRPQNPSRSAPVKSLLLRGSFVGRNMGERFYCPRGGYARPLKGNEDALRLHVLHEQRCNPVMGGHIWLSFITEDNVAWLPGDDNRSILLGSRGPLRDEQRQEKTQELSRVDGCGTAEPSTSRTLFPWGI